MQDFHSTGGIMSDKLKELERQLSEGIGTLTFAEGQGLLFEYVHEVLRIMKDYSNRFER